MQYKTLLKKYGLLFALCLSMNSIAGAVDHNNVDAGRPLNFDDAESVAYHEMAFEGGLSGILTSRERTGLGLSSELLYGFALNTQAGVDVDAGVGSRSGSSETDFDVEGIGLNLLYNFNREYNNVPAFALRGDVALPTEKKDRGAEIRLRGILSKYLIQYDRLHINLDSTIDSNPEENERIFRPGLVLGYSKPIGYPQGFSRTGLGEISVHTPARQGTGPILTLGLGIRQQVTVRSVIDLGIQSDILGGGDAPRDNIRIVAGYSIGF